MQAYGRALQKLGMSPEKMLTESLSQALRERFELFGEEGPTAIVESCQMQGTKKLRFSLHAKVRFCYRRLSGLRNYDLNISVRQELEGYGPPQELTRSWVKCIQAHMALAARTLTDSVPPLSGEGGTEFANIFSSVAISPKVLDAARDRVRTAAEEVMRSLDILEAAQAVVDERFREILEKVSPAGPHGTLAEEAFSGIRDISYGRQTVSFTVRAYTDLLPCLKEDCDVGADFPPDQFIERDGEFITKAVREKLLDAARRGARRAAACLPVCLYQFTVPGSEPFDPIIRRALETKRLSGAKAWAELPSRILPARWKWNGLFLYQGDGIYSPVRSLTSRSRTGVEYHFGTGEEAEPEDVKDIHSLPGKLHLLEDLLTALEEPLRDIAEPIQVLVTEKLEPSGYQFAGSKDFHHLPVHLGTREEYIRACVEKVGKDAYLLTHEEDIWRARLHALLPVEHQILRQLHESGGSLSWLTANTACDSQKQYFEHWLDRLMERKVPILGKEEPMVVMKEKKNAYGEYYYVYYANWNFKWDLFQTCKPQEYGPEDLAFLTREAAQAWLDRRLAKAKSPESRWALFRVLESKMPKTVFQSLVKTEAGKAFLGGFQGEDAAYVSFVLGDIPGCKRFAQELADRT